MIIVLSYEALINLYYDPSMSTNLQDAILWLPTSSTTGTDMHNLTAVIYGMIKNRSGVTPRDPSHIAGIVQQIAKSGRLLWRNQPTVFYLGGALGQMFWSLGYKSVGEVFANSYEEVERLLLTANPSVPVYY